MAVCRDIRAHHVMGATGNHAFTVRSCGVLDVLYTLLRAGDLIRECLNTRSSFDDTCTIRRSQPSHHSRSNHVNSFSTDTLSELSNAFRLDILVASPAVLMLLLPLFRVNIFIAFLVSILAAFACTVVVQGYSVLDALKVVVMGLHVSGGVKVLFNGVGLVSMIRTCIVLVFSGAFAGVLDGTGILSGLHGKILAMIERFGRFPVILFVGTCANAVFCNQTAGVIMTVQLMKKLYADSSALALDVANSAVITAPLVSWCIAGSVPLEIIDVN